MNPESNRIETHFLRKWIIATGIAWPVGMNESRPSYTPAFTQFALIDDRAIDLLARMRFLAAA